ncbi:MAG: hypothetical protein ACPG40_02495 [Alphaproteobacteria bacterium]
MHAKDIVSKPLKRRWSGAIAGLLMGLAPSAVTAQTTVSAPAVQPSFNIHSSAGVQAEPGLSVILQTDDQPQFEIFLPELLVQMAREANRGTIALVPALGHVVVLPMPEFVLSNPDRLPVISEVDKASHRVFDLLPAGSTSRTFKRVHGLSVKKGRSGLTAEDDARAGLAGLEAVCLPEMSGYQYEERASSGRGVLLTACASFNSTTARELDASIRGTVDISMSYVIDDTAFRFYSIHRSGSWNPTESPPPLSESEVRAVVGLLDKAMIFEGIDENTLAAAFLMAEN